MAAMGEITLNVKIVGYTVVHSTMIFVSSRNYPPLDDSIVASCAQFWLAWTTTTGKNNCSDGIQVAS
jgi:hypothetical protein